MLVDTPFFLTLVSWDHRTTNLVDTFPTPIKRLSFDCNITHTILVETYHLSKFVIVSKYVKALFIEKYQGKMNGVSFECLLSEAMKVDAQICVF